MKHIFLALLGLSCMPELDDGDDTWEDFHTPPEWACLREPIEVAPAEGRVLYAVPIVDFNSQPGAPTPVPGVTIKVCTTPSCVPEYQPCNETSGAQCVAIAGGPVLWTLDVPAGFSNGTLRLSAPDYVDMDYVLGGPMIGSPTSAGGLVRGGGVYMVPLDTRLSIYNSLGLDSIDETRGVLAIRAMNCANERASGVTVQALNGDPGGVAFSLSNNNVATGYTLETDDRGVAGFVNLAAQSIEVQGLARYSDEFTREFGGPTTLSIRPNVITLAEVRHGIDVWGQ